jgi:ribonuclease HI
MPKQKYYVVWKGRKTGVFTSWVECEKHVKGYVGAQFKAFDNEAQADAAFLAKYEDYKGKPATSGKWRVDAACSGAPGKLEFRGVNTETGEEIFHAGPYAEGTNNVGEFLAVVHALTWQFKHNMHVPIYSDSENAIIWVNNGQCKTRLKHTAKNAVLFALIHSAENWLAENELPEDKLLKWDTELWGENPADFGRK